MKKVGETLGNKVLHHQPPEIAEEEMQLPREARTTLSLVRLGYSKLLNSYQLRINEEVADVCTDCKSHSRTTTLLFLCPGKPTGFKPVALWLRLVEAAAFLVLPKAITWMFELLQQQYCLLKCGKQAESINPRI